jgi:hypothetical protein
MEEVVKIGAVYGLTPNEIAEIAGWWSPPKGERSRQDTVDPRMREILQELAQMDKASRERTIEMLYNLMVGARMTLKSSVSF